MTGLLLVLAALAGVRAVSVPFSNCLADTPGVAFVPLSVEAQAVPTSNSTELEFVVHGTVLNGAIADVNVTANKFTTMRVEGSVIYKDLVDRYERFCDFVGPACPLAPGSNVSMHYAYDYGSQYKVVSIETTFYIIDPSDDARLIGCVQVETTPLVPPFARHALQFTVVATFLLALALHIVWALASPWRSLKYDAFKLVANYNAEPRALRLVTPGALDMLHDLQLVFFTGSLNLAFPGFFQPLIATVSWSALLFSGGVVHKEHLDQSSGLYSASPSQTGLERMLHALLMNSPGDSWLSFLAIFIVVVAGSMVLVLVLCGLYFMVRLHRSGREPSTTATEYWANAMACTRGVALRLVLRVFALPLLTLSFFELYVAARHRSSHGVAAGAALVLVGWLAYAATVVVRITRGLPQRGRLHDLRGLLHYGALYGLYSDQRTVVVALDLATTVGRALAFGALQGSGLAQFILLALVELAYLVLFTSAMPYIPGIRMNHATVVLSVLRVAKCFMLIAFLPALGVNSGTRSAMAYALLVLEVVLVLAFLVHVVASLVELAWRRGRVHGLNHSPYGQDKSWNPAGGYALQYTQSSREVPLLRTSTEASTVAGPLGRPVSASDDFAVSPVSELQTINNADFYRPPRRKRSSTDWAYMGAYQEPVDEGEPQYQYNGSVNYAVREADVYFTKRLADQNSSRNPSIPSIDPSSQNSGQSNGQNSGQNTSQNSGQNSQNTVQGPPLTAHQMANPAHNPNLPPRRGILHLWRKPVHDELQPTGGFQVMRPQPQPRPDPTN